MLTLVSQQVAQSGQHPGAAGEGVLLLLEFGVEWPRYDGLYVSRSFISMLHWMHRISAVAVLMKMLWNFFCRRDSACAKGYLPGGR